MLDFLHKLTRIPLNLFLLGLQPVTLLQVGLVSRFELANPLLKAGHVLKFTRLLANLVLHRSKLGSVLPQLLFILLYLLVALFLFLEHCPLQVIDGHFDLTEFTLFPLDLHDRQTICLLQGYDAATRLLK